MDWKRLVPPGWFAGYLAGFSLLAMGLILLGEAATGGDKTAGAALTAILGLVWAWLASLGRRRQLAQEA